MTIYTSSQAADLATGIEDVRSKAVQIKLSYDAHKFRNNRAREFVYHGFLRRLGTLEFSLERIYQILPPEFSEIPSSDVIKETEICIHSSLINTFGAIDNLAWIWVSETGLKKEAGGPLPSTAVGLGAKSVRVRESFSDDFQKRLIDFDDWHDSLSEFRHALAHRVPPYIPPYGVEPQNATEYKRLSNALFVAQIRNDKEALIKIESRLAKIKFFRPIATHSFSEGARQIAFHAQLIANFATVHSLSMAMLEELSAIPDS